MFATALHPRPVRHEALTTEPPLPSLAANYSISKPSQSPQTHKLYQLRFRSYIPHKHTHAQAKANLLTMKMKTKPSDKLSPKPNVKSVPVPSQVSIYSTRCLPSTKPLDGDGSTSTDDRDRSLSSISSASAHSSRIRQSTAVPRRSSSLDINKINSSKAQRSSRSDIDMNPAQKSSSNHRRTLSRRSTASTASSTLGSLSGSDIDLGVEPSVQQNARKPWPELGTSRSLVAETHEGKLVTKLPNDQLRVLTCRITIDPQDQSREEDKYKEIYEIDANAQNGHKGVLGRREDVMHITRVESNSTLPKPATELLQTVKRRSTASLSAAALFTSNADEDEDTNNGCGTRAWLFFSRICTLFLPDSLLCFVGNKDMDVKELGDMKQAWREKIALCMIMASSSFGFLFVCLILPSYILKCGKETTSEINMGCAFFNTRIVDYTLCVIIGVVLTVQCCASFILACKKKPIITADTTASKVLVAMPCYNEGFKELNKTIKSVADTTYPVENKVFIAIADGQITGKGEPASTPEILSCILGYDNAESQNTFHNYKSVGSITDNYAQVHYGTSNKGLKYLVIEKVGTKNERDSPRAGNRGKRDSLVIMMGLLNRIHYGKDLTSLDIAIIDALEYLQVSVDDVEHLLAIDADTRISKESISYMVAAMKKEDDILALCGETKVENKTQSWVTGLQVFEYYQSHHMKKAFEAMFGCVTCLPGCFTMYRLASQEGQPLLSADYVYNKYSTNKVETLHEKNLFHLGEDRYLTTLLLLKFEDMKLSFVPDATCHTVVPHTFSILLSQRRRWINSTFHNMIELLRVNTMCGICCFSMRAIVVLDLISTFLLPACIFYIGYLCIRALFWAEIPPLMLLITIGLTVLVHIAVFLIRNRWDYLWWAFIYFVGVMPVFYFILPLYSFYHMDDFSWGTTRQVTRSQTLTRQRGVRNLVIDQSDSEKSRYEEIEFTNELELDDDLKDMFARVRVRQ